MRVTTLILGVPVLAVFAFAQAERSTETQSTTTTEKRTETKTSENMMETKKFKGMLVDANCGGAGAANRSSDMSGSATTTSTTKENTSDPKTTSTETSTTTSSSATSSTQTGHESSSADRSASDMGNKSKMSGTDSKWQSCPVTASTTAFGLVTSDGRMLPFDDVGNTRAQEAVKNHDKWTKSNKPPKVKVHGVLMGETLQVQEIR